MIFRKTLIRSLLLERFSSERLHRTIALDCLYFRSPTSIPNLCFDALAIRVSDHHGRELHPNSGLSVRPKAWHSPIRSWSLVLHPTIYQTRNQNIRIFTLSISNYYNQVSGHKWLTGVNTGITEDCRVVSHKAAVCFAAHDDERTCGA